MQDMRYSSIIVILSSPMSVGRFLFFYFFRAIFIHIIISHSLIGFILGRRYCHLLSLNTAPVDNLFHSTKEGDVGALCFMTIKAIGSSIPPLRIGVYTCCLEHDLLKLLCCSRKRCKSDVLLLVCDPQHLRL